MDDREIHQRLSALEDKLDHIYRHLVGLEGATGAMIPPMKSRDQRVSEAVRDLVAQGHTLQAIKQYRAETGCDLVVARDTIEALRR